MRGIAAASALWAAAFTLTFAQSRHLFPGTLDRRASWICGRVRSVIGAAT